MNDDQTLIKKTIKVMKEVRLNSKLTQLELAKLLSISRTSISRWERTGKIPFSKMNEWFKACKYKAIIIMIDKNAKQLPNEKVCVNCNSDKMCPSYVPANDFSNISMVFLNNLDEDCPYILEHMII